MKDTPIGVQECKFLCPDCKGSSSPKLMDTVVSIGMDTAVMQEDDFMGKGVGGRMKEPVRKDWDLRLIVLGVREYVSMVNSDAGKEEMKEWWKMGDFVAIKEALIEASNKIHLSGIEDARMVERMLDNYPDSDGPEVQNIFSAIKWVENWLYYVENVECNHWV